jgi:hypothetical protein
LDVGVVTGWLWLKEKGEGKCKTPVVIWQPITNKT